MTIQESSRRSSLVIRGDQLTISDVFAVASRSGHFDVHPSDDLSIKMTRSTAIVKEAVLENRKIYGVTTGFGGLADTTISHDEAAASQKNLLSFLAAGAGSPIDRRHVRGAMLLRANVLARGLSGVRFDLVDRLLRFLNADATPIVRELGSIGASGDLIPLSCLARAITGQSPFVKVQLNERIVDGMTALKELGLEPLELLPKEGLAIVNGTSFSAAIAANCISETRRLMAFALVAHGMIFRSLLAHREPFEEFVHRQKPHPGQVWLARMMKQLLADGCEEVVEKSSQVQDRYSIRCLPQYMGPIAEGVARVKRIVETEMNAVSDNPLIDPDEGRFYQSGNFLGQYIAVAMDDLRRYIGLMAKHLDIQIATIVSPEFNNGLPASLRGNDSISYNMGLKGLQITGNSIMPMLTYYGNPLVEHFPTHAEQFNQNVNGLSWGSANMAWRSVELFQHYMAVSLLFSIQACDIRAKVSLGHYDGRSLLAPLMVPLYEALCKTMNCKPGSQKPFLFDDTDQWLEQQLEVIRESISTPGAVVDAIAPILADFDESLSVADC